MVETLLKRRSARNYKEIRVEPEKAERLIQAALLCPTSRNQKSCEIIVVDDKQLIERMSKVKPHGSGFMEGAPLAIAVIGNTDTTDAWIEDASIAATAIQLEAEELGLGSCWIQVRNRQHSDEVSAEEYIRNLLDIPENYGIDSIIAAGYKASETKDHTLDEIDRGRLHLNKF